ncbi:fused response regulator/phosphatase [Marinobacter pelagius]|uniref:PP2C family protein-serine/threonine phosphatase n=1 Tax=Marinobacter sp. C7 TaxID=2951363 RepID=UPI001EF120A7|nr:fused response regulator/phosphatase [Marinobacter sp. C7]
MTQRNLRILIADDSDTDRLILQAIIKRLGHQVIEAADGLEAVQKFRDECPDIVLLDALMPRMDGMEAARHIKALAGERLVPLIFLTSLSDAEDLARCLEAGGDDFLTKPYNRVIIEAKIKAFDRMRRMHDTLSSQHEQICERNRQLLEEQAIARRVFDNVAHTGCLDSPNIRYHASPLSVFNGDVLFASPRPAGGMLIFLGDFTGHGLPAAIGAMPVAEIFYGMARKGFSGADVLREINQKLKRILPTGMFCCGAMVEADFKLGQLRVWNGALPEAWIIRGEGESLLLPSRHLPLGILPPKQFECVMEVVQVRPGDRLLVMTDGVLEAANDRGELFGLPGIRQCLEHRQPHTHPFDAVLEAVRQFSDRADESDDLTLVGLDITDQPDLPAEPEQPSLSALAGPTEWRCEYEIRERTLGDFSPLPLLLHICLEVPGLRTRSGEIYTLLSELYNNALEHGVLQLPSEWKHSADGFGKYYSERQARLARVDGHYIRFSLHHTRKPGGGRLRVVCEDSGAGFDFSNHPLVSGRDDESRAPRYAGRGLLLLKRLSRSIKFRGKGNHVEIIYDWNFSAHQGDGDDR